ncbi:MAG: prepilin-type N-terminal cleavage/methylation domain-containing protein [Planctomycetota bacterium]
MRSSQYSWILINEVPPLPCSVRSWSLRAARGFTLTELVVVLLVLVAVAGIVVPTVGGLGEDSKRAATEASLVRVREALLGDASGAGYLADMDGLTPGTPPVRTLLLRDLFLQGAAPAYAPATRRGWNGPYLRHVAGTYAITDPPVGSGFTSAYGAPGDPCVLDGWGNPIVVQRPTAASGGSDEARDRNVRLVSAGPNGVLDSDPAALDPATLSGTQGDDFVLFLFVAGT